MGIFLAFIALFSWGFGDFLIQKSTRKFGDWLALFYICASGTIGLLPFVYKDIIPLASNPKNLVFLTTVSTILLFTALFDFEAFKRGKISVVEPINALEIPIAVFLATFVLRESLNFWQGTFIILLIIAIFLVTTKSFHHLKKIHAERGIWFMLASAFGMGVSDFLLGIGSREINPLVINWFISLFILAVVCIYLGYKSKFKEIAADFRTNKKLILSISFLDNIGWIAYTFSMVTVPIAIATGISESYIILGALLGLFINKEKLKKHQLGGLFVCIVSALALAILTEK